MTPRHVLHRRLSILIDWILVITCTAILVLAFIAVTGCSVPASHAGTAEEAVTPTSLLTVPARATPRYLRLTGTLVARQRAEVAADASGRVTSAMIERGSRVAAGAPLVRLDARHAVLGRDQAVAEGAATDAQRRRAAADCTRADRLFAEQVIHQREHERLRAECEVTGWSSAAAEVRRRQAQQRLHDSTVRAPFAGVIDERLVDTGEFVQAGQPVATLVDLDELRLELSVHESQIGDVRLGAQVSFEVAAFPGRIFHATVRHVPASLRAGHRDLVIEAVHENPAHELRPGMFASARLHIGEHPDPVVPRAAVRGGAGSPRVFVVHQGRLEERLVQLGEDRGEEIAILSGLRAGDRIASPLSESVRDGLKVE